MLKRRGLVSQSSHTAKPHASTDKRDRSGSESDSSLSSSLSSGFSCSDPETAKPAQSDELDKSQPPHSEEAHTTTEIVPEDGLDRPEEGSKLRKGGKTKKKEKPDYSDENRWKKMKIHGSEKEIMVDMTRVQKYVDHDSAGVTSVQQEVQQAKGNFRQQQMADYSDL